MFSNQFPAFLDTFCIILLAEVPRATNVNVVGSTQPMLVTARLHGFAPHVACC